MRCDVLRQTWHHSYTLASLSHFCLPLNPSPLRLNSQRSELQILSKGFVKIPVRMLSVVNVRVRRSEVSDPSNAPFLVKTKVVSSESAKEMPTRWNLLSADVPLGASPDEVARETIAAHFDSGWVEGYSLDVMRKVNELDSSGLTRGNRAHLPGLATEGIRSTDADDAKRQLETCSQSKYPGLPCVYTVHL